jgi:hypothetical protein
MTAHNRREFLADIGRGVLIAATGSSMAAELGFGTVLADEKPKELTFGKLEPLVCLMQETPAAKLLPLLIQRLKDGSSLQELTAAAALANARTFGGEDYVGFHTMMALAPAYHMSQELSGPEQALPVLKVLFRNTNRAQETGGRKNEVLHPVQGKPNADASKTGEAILAQVRKKDANEAEQLFAGCNFDKPELALDQLLTVVEDCQEVHRIVLPYRAWALLPVVGKEHAHTLLRQSVRYCVKGESPSYAQYFDASRKALPELLERAMKPQGRREPPAVTDAWIGKLSETIFRSSPQDAAAAVAEAIAHGYPTDAIGEAIILATNQLVLRDNGRPKNQTSANKPEGSCHGDSIGVHACDSANAWRNLARVAGPRNRAACLILGAWQAAKDRGDRGGDFFKWEPYPRAEASARVKGTDGKSLLAECEDAIRNKDQALASAAVAAYGEKKLPEGPVFDLLRRYAISEDGALHAEKFYLTATEEFRNGRPAFRWRHLIALARVTASAFGYPAPGQKEARLLLKL